MDNVNNNVFCNRVKDIEEEVIRSTIQQAHDYQGKVYVNILTNRFCDKAFKLFESKMREQFPEEGYSTLIKVALHARTNLFFVSLKEKIEKIFQKKT